MLRFALLMLLIANAGYLAWTQGWMATLGWAPKEQSEPYRLQQQVRPDVLSIAQPEPVSVPAPVATAPVLPAEPLEEILPQETLCLQSDSMDEAQSQAVQKALHSSDVPSSSWEVRTTSVTGRWMVYLGKFPNEMAMEKRRAELRGRKIGYDRAGGNWEPGLSLGRFSTEESATRELSSMLNQGVRGARVVQERAPQTLYVLRFDQATAAQRTLLRSMQPALSGINLRPCAAAPANAGNPAAQMAPAPSAN